VCVRQGSKQLRKTAWKAGDVEEIARNTMATAKRFEIESGRKHETQSRCLL